MQTNLAKNIQLLLMLVLVVRMSIKVIDSFVIPVEVVVVD